MAETSAAIETENPNSIRLVTIRLKQDIPVLGNTIKKGKIFEDAELNLIKRECKIELDGAENLFLTMDQYETVSFNGAVDKDVLQDVIDRMKRYNGKYKKALQDLNAQFELGYTIKDHVIRVYE